MVSRSTVCVGLDAGAEAGPDGAGGVARVRRRSVAEYPNRPSAVRPTVRRVFLGDMVAGR